MDKVIYFKDVGLWYLPDADSVPSGGTCNLGAEMLQFVESSEGKRINIRDKCCMRERYWLLDGGAAGKKKTVAIDSGGLAQDSSEEGDFPQEADQKKAGAKQAKSKQKGKGSGSKEKTREKQKQKRKKSSGRF